MKISSKGRYALRVVLDIASNSSEGPVSIKDISKRQGMSVKYMEQICSLLVCSGILKSSRGQKGGYSIIGTASDYTVGDILRAVEGPISLAPCLNPSEDQCERCDSCLTIAFWVKLNDAIHDVIDGTTLQDLLEDGARKNVITVE